MTRSIKTMEANSIKYMLKFVAGYEQVKEGQHPQYRYARDYFAAHDICFQNFYKFYKRYIQSGRNVETLLPLRRGPRPKYGSGLLVADGSLESVILEYRAQGYNKYTIAECLKRRHWFTKSCSASSVYRVLKAFGVSRFKRRVGEEVRKIVKHRAGELLHVDCHFLPKGIVRGDPRQRYYTLGVMDDYSRVVWVEVMHSTKSLEATFAMMDALLILNNRYGITGEEVLTDNGSEFCSSDQRGHPFERLLLHFGLKHRRTKPYRPQTNGKIERFWKAFEDEVIEGSAFESLEALQEAVLGYNLYYNEMRPHQGIGGKKPFEMLELILIPDQQGQDNPQKD